jgi:transcriptional regulator with XRE-family HTH domain
MWHRRLLDEIRKRELTYPQVARLTGVPVESVKKYARGRVASPRGETLLLLAAGLGLSPTWLQSGVGERYAEGRVPAVAESFAVDFQLVADIVQVIEEEAARTGTQLTPEQYGKLVAYCYQQESACTHEGAHRANHDAVRKLFRLVC